MPLYDMYCTTCGYEGEQLAKPNEKIACPSGCESPLERAAVQQFAVSTGEKRSAVALLTYAQSQNGVHQRDLFLPADSFHGHIRDLPFYNPSDTVTRFVARKDTHDGSVHPVRIDVERKDGSGYGFIDATSGSIPLVSAPSTEKLN